MKICITARGATPDAQVEERFGRAPYFILTDAETGEFEAIENRFKDAAGGVGPKAAQVLIDHKVTVLLSGAVGENARQVLVAAGIAMIPYKAGGTVRDALDWYTRTNQKTTGQKSPSE